MNLTMLSSLQTVCVLWVVVMVRVVVASPPAGAAETQSTLPWPPREIVSFHAGNALNRHPRVFFTQEKIKLARQRIQNDADAKGILERFITKANEQLAIGIEPLDESWWDDARDKPWEQTYPDIYVHTHKEPMVYGHGAAILAIAWLLTGEAKYETHATAMLMNLAPYRFRAEHFDVGMNYAGWGMHALKAYDALFDRLDAGQREALDGLMTRMARAVLKNDIYWIENDIGGGINNHLAWHKMMLGLLGLFYERPELVDYCMYGRRGMVPLLEDGLLDDGLWRESSLFYQWAAIGPMMAMGNCQRRTGGEPSMLTVVSGNGRTLKQACDAMFDVIFPDGLIPPVGDAYGMRIPLWKVPTYEEAWAAWGDTSHAWLLRQNPQREIDALFSPPLPADPPVPPVGTTLLPEHGYAFLRSHRDADYWGTDAWCAFLTYDRSNVHANADKLSLMLFGQKRLLVSDVEGIATTPHAFSAPIQRELNRGGLSQNTVMIDGLDQRCSPRMLRLVEFRDLPAEKRVTAVDTEGILYDGVRQARTIAMTADYVLDVFQVDVGQQPRQIDWIMHAMDKEATAPDEIDTALKERCKPFELPTSGPWPWLRNGREFAPTGPIDLEWRGGLARLRLHLLGDGIERVILLDYPASDKPEDGRIPMTIVRTRGIKATFVAVWLIGDAVSHVDIKALPEHEGNLVYEVNTNDTIRKHLIPKLQSMP